MHGLRVGADELVWVHYLVESSKKLKIKVDSSIIQIQYAYKWFRSFWFTFR